MNTFTLCFALSLIVLGSSSIKVESNDIENRKETTPNSMEILEAILNDPEFLSLNSHQQLRVLVIMYEMLDRQMQRQTFIDRKKRDIKQ
jgi:hypothetical protein